MREISIELVKKMRQLTGAGILDCKNALRDSDGDIDKAMQLLREKGMTQVLKKSTREAREGLISAYIHAGNRIGVLIEVNCETDFVARTDEFKTLVKELGLQIAAANPLWIFVEDIPEDVVDRECEIYRNQALREGKPEKAIEKIVEGKLQKFYQQVCLLEQPYIRDAQGKEKVKDIVNSAIAKTGENIVVKRFARFQLGETSE